jgi:hypothetical protein
VSSRNTVAMALLAAAFGLAGAGASPSSAADPTPRKPQDLEQAISDQAQRTTIAFSGLALITGNLEAQSFFPPGKLADYWGFQLLRDNDPDDMGHNTSFLTRVACNVLYVLDASQVDRLKTLAHSQAGAINEYGYRRFPLMKAFRRLIDGAAPAGSPGLSLDALRAASRDMYELDGRICFERAVVFADIYRSLTPSQTAYLDAMVGKGWASWPDVAEQDVRDKTAGLPHDESVAVMTYAGDIFAWYAGNTAADVYFCPERHGTYYGGFYIKDAPAMGRPGYSIDEQLTATAGAALCDSSKGYVTAEQASLVSSLVDVQRDNLYAGTSNIVKARTEISNALRSLVGPVAPTSEQLAAVQATVLAKSGEYGELDGENNGRYATAFSQLRASLSASQLTSLDDLRRSIMSGTYSDGTPFDFTTCATPFLFSAVISDPSVLDPYVSDTDYLFLPAVPAFSVVTPAPIAGLPVEFHDTTAGAPLAWSWDFGDGATSALQHPTHVYAEPGTYTVSLSATSANGADTTTSTVSVAPACDVTAMAALRAPLRLRISGAGFLRGCTVLVNGVRVPRTRTRAGTRLVAYGPALRRMLRSGAALEIVVRNPDGGRSETCRFTR